MGNKNQDLLNKDELTKSLQDFDFSEEEIASILEKAEKEGKLEVRDKEVVDDSGEYDKEEMKKAYDGVMKAKAEFDKSMSDFLDKFGNVPGLKTPDDFTKKSEDDELEKAEDFEIEKADEDELEKAEEDFIQKAFGEKVDGIEKSISSYFENQNKVNEELMKSLTKLNEDVTAIAETPNPLKSLLGSYGNLVIEKGIKMKDDGTEVYNLRNKSGVTEAFEKSLDKIDNEKDKQVVRDMISTYTISGVTSETGLNIVKKALNIDFEK